MLPFVQLIIVLSLIIAAAKLAGCISIRLRQPSVFGELLAGLILGPTFINILHLPFITIPYLEEMIHLLGELGVLLLMFLAGLELDLKDLMKSSKAAALSGVCGVILPIALGAGFGLILQETVQQALFLGIALAATSVSISAQTLFEMKQLQTRVGMGLLGAAVFDDILVILILSAFLALASGAAGLSAVILIFFRMLLFLILAFLFGRYLLPPLAHWASRLPVSQATLTFALVILFVFGIGAELIGSMAAITGSFLAGLMFGQTSQKNIIEHGIKTFSYSFFVPIFFVSIGLAINLRDISLSAVPGIIVIILIALISKIIGAGMGARLAGFSWLQSLQMGIGMISRGEVGLIVANIGHANGLIEENIFITIIAVVLFTTLLTPILLRWSFSLNKNPGKPSSPPPSMEASCS